MATKGGTFARAMQAALMQGDQNRAESQAQMAQRDFLVKRMQLEQEFQRNMQFAKDKFDAEQNAKDRANRWAIEDMRQDRADARSRIEVNARKTADSKANKANERRYEFNMQYNQNITERRIELEKQLMNIDKFRNYITGAFDNPAYETLSQQLLGEMYDLGRIGKIYTERYNAGLSMRKIFDLGEPNENNENYKGFPFENPYLELNEPDYGGIDFDTKWKNFKVK